MQQRSQRQLRVGEQIRHVIVECLLHGNFTDEVLYHNTQNVTVSEVRISPDLKNATAFVYALQGENFEAILKSMNNEARIFQRFIGKNLTLKFTPKIRFKEDTSFENANNIERVFYEIHKEGDSSQ